MSGSVDLLETTEQLSATSTSTAAVQTETPAAVEFSIADRRQRGNHCRLFEARSAKTPRSQPDSFFWTRWMRDGGAGMKKFLFLLVAAGGMLIATSSTASAHNYFRGYGHPYRGYGWGYRNPGFSITFNRGFRGRGVYGYGGFPVRRNFGFSYGYGPRIYGGGFYGGGGYYGGCGY